MVIAHIPKLIRVFESTEITEEEQIERGDRISIDAIYVMANRRTLRNLDELKKSISEFGLINPITITENVEWNTRHENDGERPPTQYFLVAGYHRLEACKQLGWETIPAIIFEGNEIDLELIEIDENLIRNELTALERSEVLLRRKELYEAKYPETKQHIAGAIAKHHPATPESSVAPSFSKDTAQKTGQGESTIRQDVQIARNLTPETKEAIRISMISNMKMFLGKKYYEKGNHFTSKSRFFG